MTDIVERLRTNSSLNEVVETARAALKEGGDE